ncbi:hypothetical protein V8B97DRAFT_2020675 [Scleroderma yunnanense]
MSHSIPSSGSRQYFTILKQDLALVKGDILFTSDLWLDKNYQPFIVITAHWILKGDAVGSLKLNAKLIAFHHISGNHTGTNLASTILCLLNCAGVTEKGRTIPCCIVDNSFYHVL